MLYLAEVQKQSNKFGLGGGRTELKLLACQRGENNWSAVSGDEVVLAEDATNFKDGTLVLVDLNTGKQVQRIQEAARQLVGILQDFSRLQEKFKTQQEEIEQWKESLTYQSQELNRREMEMEARREQMEQLEGELERLEQQRQEIDRSKDESKRLRSEIDQARQDIETTRAALQQQRQQLEEQQASLKSSPSLNTEQSALLGNLLNQLSNPISISPLQTQLDRSREQVAIALNGLEQHRQRLRSQRLEAEQLQQTVDSTTTDIEQQWQQWQQAQDTLTQNRAELVGEQQLLQTKQDYAQTLKTLIQNRQTLLEQLQNLASRQSESDQVTVSVKVDVQALEAMSLEQLETEVKQLEKEWDRWFRMVREQEEELKYKLEDIKEIQEKLKTISDSERENLQTELTDEQDAYQMLNETLVGQRRTLKEREEHKTQYQAVLLRRQGLPPVTSGGAADFKLVIATLETQQQEQKQQLQTLETEIQQISSGFEQRQTDLNTRTNTTEQTRQQLETTEQSWIEQQRMVAELWGRISLYQEMLQPVQDSWNQVRQQLEQTTTELNQLLEISQNQTQTTEQLRQVLSVIS
ncbi:pilus motility taxis protein HmpF [Planktothrix agardhii]|uniref:pilus motility taxis protein HmpF n=1 Tax=Planktothrix agardhii TaxID=1160 RepID=UPI001D0A379B|nr:pilus motility taxis protein HmpF [Planktothrix agardhii]MCB8752353.1 pilus motility taxis protein HmpF [Planktothrix agardhii 1810]